MKISKNFRQSDKYKKTEYVKFIGVKYNELTVVDFPGELIFDNVSYSTPAVHVRCSCGKEKIASWYQVKNGNTISCGHLNKLYKYHTDPYACGFQTMFTKYKGRIAKAGKEFNLDMDEFRKLITSKCTYCGVKPYLKATASNCKFWPLHNTIDRLDPKKGYILGNVVPCCKQCNFAKNDLTHEEFMIYVNRLTKFASEKNRAKTVKAEKLIPC